MTANQNKPEVQILLLDTYNGSPGQAESYRQITGVTVPILQRASNGLAYASAQLEDIVVVDQEGIVRLSISASDIGMLSQVKT